MDNPIPKNIPEIPVSGGSGGIIMVELGRKGVKTGFCGGIGGLVAVGQNVIKSPRWGKWSGYRQHCANDQWTS